MRRPSALAALLVFVVTPVGSARAQASAADKAMAEALFQEGQKLFLDGQLDTACAKLEESQRIDPKLGTLLNIATCHEKQGKLASAWAEFTEAASLASRAKRPDRVRFAREHADALEKQLCHVTLASKSTPGLELQIDGRALGGAGLASAIPLDPGHHEIGARAPGKKPWSVSVVLEPGKDQEIAIPALEDEPRVEEHSPPPALAAQIVAPAAPAAPLERTPSGQRTLGFVVGALGVAGVGVGAVAGVLTFVEEGRARERCPRFSCPDQTSFDQHEKARTAATISTVAFAGGLAAVGVGLVLVLTAPSARQASLGRALLAPRRPGLEAKW